MKVLFFLAISYNHLLTDRIQNQLIVNKALAVYQNQFIHCMIYNGTFKCTPHDVSIKKANFFDHVHIYFCDLYCY